MKILGLAGYARSGKDTAGNALAELGWKRIAFADVLREFAYTLNPAIQSEHGFYTPLRWIIDEYGWNGYKRTQWSEGVRDLLQRLGTECGRQLVSDTIWIDATFNRMDPDGKYVISDVRFPNEVEAIRIRGGVTIRIDREGVGPANFHGSETAVDHLDLPVVTNNGTLEEFESKFRTYINDFFSS